MHIEVNQIPNSLRSWVHIWKPGFLSGFSARGGQIRIIRGVPLFFPLHVQVSLNFFF